MLRSLFVILFVIGCLNIFAQNTGAISGNLVDSGWGQREFSIRTIDGYRITFGEEV